jgi:hypothetical protein
MIRGKAKACPFGLPVCSGCETIGAAVSMLIPLDDEMSEEEVSDARLDNLDTLIVEGGSDKCTFADIILSESNTVDCKFDTTKGSRPAGNVGLNGSPYYAHTFVGNTPEPGYGYPMEYYSGNNESRNVYYGLYNIV